MPPDGADARSPVEVVTAKNGAGIETVPGEKRRRSTVARFETVQVETVPGLAPKAGTEPVETVRRMR